MTNAQQPSIVEARPFAWHPAQERPADRHAQLRDLRVHHQDDGRWASPTCCWQPDLGVRRAATLDRRGHGLSDKPSTGYDFATITEDLAAFVDLLGLRRPVIVGHSWRAHVAIEYAARFAERIVGIALVDSGVEVLDGKPWGEIEREPTPPDLSHPTQPQLGRFWNDRVEATPLSLFDVANECRVRPRLSTAEPDGADEKREKVLSLQALLPRSTVRRFAGSVHDIPLQHPDQLAGAIASFVSGLASEVDAEINPSLNLVPMSG